MTIENTIIDANEDENMGAQNKGINILTILTLIGSGITLISGLYSFFTIDKSYEMMQNMNGGMAETGNAAIDGMMGDAMVMMEKTYEYRYILLVLAIIGGVLCLLGALKMRKGSLQGLWFWMVGEWLPVIVNILIIGIGVFSGIQMIGFIVPIVFTVLYFAHKKYLA